MTRLSLARKLPRGVAAIPLVLIMLASLALIIGAVGKLALKRNFQAASEGFDKRARYAAYAGCQYGLLALGSNVAWAPATPVVLALPDDPETFFTLEVYNNYDGSLGLTYTAPDGTEVKEGFVFLKSRGTSVRGASSYNTSVSGLAVRGDRFFNHAAVGHKQVQMLNGSVTDAWSSYHQVSGFYVYHHYGRQDPSGVGPDPNPNSVPGAQSGNVVSNGTIDAIRVEGGSRVNGRAISGPLSNPAVAIVENPAGSITEAVEAGTVLKRIPRNRPPINPAEATGAANVSGSTSLPQGAYTNLNVSAGGTLRLEPGGIYMFTGDINIDGGNVVVDSTGELAEAAPAFVYFGGTAKINNATINEDGLPERLQVFAMGNGQDGFESEFRLNGNSRMWGILSGRALDIRLKNSEIFGAVKGLRVQLDNAQIHYDRALYNQPQGGISAWKLLGVVETDEVDSTAASSGGAAAGGAGPAGGGAGPAGAAGGGDAAAAAAAAAAAGGDAAGGVFGGGDAAAAAAGGDAAGGDAASGGDAGGDAAAGDAAAGAGGGGPAGGPAGDAAAAAAAAAGDAAGGDAAGGGDAAAGGDAAGKGGDAGGDAAAGGDGDAAV